VGVDSDRILEMPGMPDKLWTQDNMEKILEKEIPGFKKDAGKVMWDLLPWDEIEEAAKVMTDVITSGKYPIDNWKKVPGAKRRYFRSVIRHIRAWQRNEMNDPESGLHPLAHAVCCLLFLQWFDTNGYPPEE
jgi:hypothetical protein